MKDTGDRQQFASGAVRDTTAGKPRPELVSPFATERVARLSADGAVKYAPRNWEAGMPFSRCVASLERHLLAFKMGKVDEDHLAAIAWNAQALLHYEAGIAHGFLPPDLDDMPHYLTPKPARTAPNPRAGLRRVRRA